LMNNAVGYGCAYCFNSDYNKRKNELPKTGPLETRIIFSSGTSIVFSPDVVLNLINNKDKIDMEKIDDASIGEFIMNEMPDVELKPVVTNIPSSGFYIVPNVEGDSEKIKDLIKNNQIIFFRNHNGNRELDTKQMALIIEHLNKESRD